MLTNHLMATPCLDNLFIRPFIFLESVHFIPDFSMNQVATIIRSPLLMAATTDVLGGWESNVIIKVLMPLDFTDAMHVSIVLATLINKQAISQVIETFLFKRMLKGKGMRWWNMQMVNVS